MIILKLAYGTNVRLGEPTYILYKEQTITLSLQLSGSIKYSPQGSRGVFAL